MIRDRERWNRKYRGGGFPEAPSAIVTAYAPLAGGGRALDLAAGNGRNSLWLADNGFAVDAVDISEVGLGLMGRGHPKVHRICADLDTFAIRPGAYDLVVDVRFLDRRLFPSMKEGLRPGGILIFESYLEGPEGEAGGRFCRDYLLRPNELLHAFLSLTVLYYSERDVDDGDGHPSRTASLVARRPA